MLRHDWCCYWCLMYLWVRKEWIQLILYLLSLTISSLVSVSVNDEGEGSTFDNSSSSTIKLNTGTVLYLREVNKFLALVCILREDNFDKQGLIDYNFQCFRQSIQEVFETAFNKSKSSAHQQSIIYNNSFDSKQSNGFMDDWRHESLKAWIIDWQLMSTSSHIKLTASSSSSQLSLLYQYISNNMI